MEADDTQDLGTMDESSKNAPRKHRVLDGIDSSALFSGGRQRGQISDLREIGISMNSRRSAAPNVHSMRGAASAWIDEDDSGTYDPNEARREPTNCQSKRAKKIKAAGGTDGASHSSEDAQDGHDMLVKPAVHSKDSLEVLKSRSPTPLDDDGSDSGTTSEPHDSANNVILSTKRESIKPVRLSEQATKNFGFLTYELTEDDPRRRGCKACFESGDDHCSLIEDPYAYPCVTCEEDNIDCEHIVPPVLKRSFEQCKKKKRAQCSYIVDGGKGVDSCVSCQRLRIDCFAGPLRPSHAKKLQKYEFQSDAAPQARLSSQQSAADMTSAPGTQDAAPPRKYVSCNQCRSQHNKCSLKRDQPGPCRKCRLSGESCKFEHIEPIEPASETENKCASVSKRKTKPKSIEKKKSRLKFQVNRNNQKLQLKRAFKKNKKGSKTNAQSRSKSRRPVPVQPRSTNGMVHVLIKTSYAHPIIFNHIPAPDGSSPCHWCSNPFFGLFGHGWRTVEVIPLHDGHGYEEIGTDPQGSNQNAAQSDGSNMAMNNNGSEMKGNGSDVVNQVDRRGWNQRGEPRSQMCFACTSARVRIMSCRAHEMKSMGEDFDSDVYTALGGAWDQVREAIRDGDTNTAQVLLQGRLCSICPRFAEYQCLAVQEDCGLDCECGVDAMVCEKKGCGLRLCGICMHFLGKIVSEKKFSVDMNVLDELVRLAESDGFHYDDGIRADASFLTTRGELNRRFESAFGRDEIDDEDGAEDDNEVKKEYEGKEIISLVEEDSKDSLAQRDPRRPPRERQQAKVPAQIEIIEISDDED